MILISNAGFILNSNVRMHQIIKHLDFLLSSYAIHIRKRFTDKPKINHTEKTTLSRSQHPINHIAQRPLASIKTLNVGGNYLRFPWQGFC